MPNSDSPTTVTSARRRRDRGSRGQIIVIFAGAAIAFMALSAIVIDVSWYWSSQVRMQRAADAAALAGVVRLPGDLAGGKTLARTEASRNGYTDGVNQVVVTPDQDPASTRRMVVTISGPINTFFARIIGLNSFPATVTSKAQFVLPVPMGSPENYWGVFGKTRAVTSTTTTSTPNPPIASNTNSGLDIATTSTPGTWTASSGTLVNAVATNDAGNAPRILTTTNGAQQVFGGFGLTSQLTTETVTGIRGIEVYLDDSFVSATCNTTPTRIQVQLSWNAGGQWTTPITTNQTAGLTTSTSDIVFGSTNLLTNWVFSAPAHAWGVNDILDANFRVRLTAVKGCATATTELRLDQLRVKAYYSITTPQPPTVTTTTTTLPDVDLKGPGDPCPSGVADCYTVTNGATLTPHGFWGTMNTEGAANANGDAFQPYYDNPLTSTAAVACAVATPGIACYDPNEYYNYAVEMPQGSTNGKVYIYDPVFCDVVESAGTGDRFFDTTAGDGTPIDTDAVTSMYEVWDTKNTLYDRGDDGPLNNGTVPDASSGDLFRNISAADSTMGGFTNGGTVPECRNYTNTPYGDGRDFHNKWYLLYSGMSGYASGSHIYRIHTTSTDPASPTQQRIANGENSFAIFASASGGTPKVYGLGAMQAFTPLSAAGNTVTSEFYLAQIDKVHATKTVEVALWDPGDTDPLTSSLEILIPSGATWVATPVTYSATLGTTNPGRADGTGSPAKPDCRTLSRTVASTTPISTFNNADATNTGKFNGCWLTIQAVIPANYQADGNGWWKIRYTMTGGTVSTPATSNDVTTWKVQILGNPVHLIVN